MTVMLEKPKPIAERQDGEVWMQPIAEILEYWNSCDGAVANANFVGGEMSSGEEIVCSGEWDCECRECNWGGELQESWQTILDMKREDYWYDDVVESLQTHGFVRPVTCELPKYGEYPQYNDGHHRLAAAIDLGMTHIPMQGFNYFVCMGDSQDWHLGQEIPKENRRGY